MHHVDNLLATTSQNRIVSFMKVRRFIHKKLVRIVMADKRCSFESPRHWNIAHICWLKMRQSLFDNIRSLCVRSLLEIPRCWSNTIIEQIGSNCILSGSRFIDFEISHWTAFTHIRHVVAMCKRMLLYSHFAICSYLVVLPHFLIDKITASEKINGPSSEIKLRTGKRH